MIVFLAFPQEPTICRKEDNITAANLFANKICGEFISYFRACIFFDFSYNKTERLKQNCKENPENRRPRNLVRLCNCNRF